MRRTVLAGLVGAGVGAGVVMMALPAALFGRVPVLNTTVSAEPAEVAVVDGQTLRLRHAVIRLLGIAAPPRGLACAPDRAGFDCGAAAGAALAALVRDREVVCHLTGRDARGFPLGLCEAAGTDLNQALVRTGWARAREDAAAGTAPPGFAAAERAARAERAGLWRDGAAPTF